MGGARVERARASGAPSRLSLAEAAGAAAFLLPVLLLLLHAADFPYLRGSAFSDLAISHYPNLLFLQRSLAQGEFPLWSPAILSGSPFAANPLSGLLYPPGWLALLFPLPLGINLTMALHILWAGAGLYRLLRVEGARAEAALIGALAFTALPKLFSHLGAGHVTLVFAVSWTPWVLLAERRWGGVTSASRLLPGGALALTALADPRWAAYAGLLWLAYALRLALHRQAGLEKMRIATLVSWMGRTAAVGAFALLGAAPLLIPLVEFTRISSRAALTAAEGLAFSLPPGQLFGLFYPPVGGAAEWMLYPGGAVMGLAVLAAAWAPARKRSRFWLGVALISILAAMGSHLPLLPLLWSAPGLNLLRVPARALFLAGLGLTAAAAWALDALLAPRDETAKPRRDRSTLALFGLAAFAALFGAAGAAFAPDTLARLRFGWGAAAFLLASALLLALKAGKMPARTAVAALAVLLLADLCGVNALGLEFRAPSAVLAEQGAVAQFLHSREAEEGPFRVYSPSYSVPQHVAAWYGLELADGVDPLRLAAYDRLMEGATGVAFKGYSVTLPAFAAGNPAEDNRSAAPDPRSLGLLNVRYVAAEYPLAVEGLDEVFRAGSTIVYRNRYALPRARVGDRPAEIVERGVNYLTVRAVGPGRLVLAEINAPGWQVRVDGRRRQIETEAGVLRAVDLGDGPHTVRFDYRPKSVVVGSVIGLLAWAGLAAGMAWEYLKSARRKPGEMEVP